MTVKMLKLTINSQPVVAAEGMTILQAARSVGIDIPTLCLAENTAAPEKHRPSCMVCVVEISGRNRLVASCAAPVEEGLVVFTDSEAVKQSRKHSVEMLLSEHLGECEAPCQLACPVGWDIPAFMEALAADDPVSSADILARQLPLAAVLGYLCHQPCRKACRLQTRGDAIEIRQLHRIIAENTDHKISARAIGKPAARVAIIGAGPAALAAASVLTGESIDCEMYFRGESPGGSLSRVSTDEMPTAILTKEIETLLKSGLTLRPNSEIDLSANLAELQEQYQAVIIATGENTLSDTIKSQLPENIQLAGACKVSSSGGSPKNYRVVRAVADGKNAAESVIAQIHDDKLTGARKTVRYGKLSDAEIEMLFSRGNGELKSPGASSLNDTQSCAAEAARCLICGCATADNCRLRDIATQLGADTHRYTGARRAMMRDDSHESIVFEPHKCILCGACASESAVIGSGTAALSAQGRGIQSNIATAYQSPLSDVFPSETDISKLADICPTAAIHTRNNTRPTRDNTHSTSNTRSNTNDNTRNNKHINGD